MAMRSSHGKWKPKFRLTFVAKYCIFVSVTIKNRFFSVSRGNIEVPAIFHYGMVHLRTLWRTLNAQSLQFFKPHLSSGKSLRNHFFGSGPIHTAKWIWDRSIYSIIKPSFDMTLFRALSFFKFISSLGGRTLKIWKIKVSQKNNQ